MKTPYPDHTRSVHQAQAVQPAPASPTISAWVKCPHCGGVLGVPLGQSQGPCVFCANSIQVYAAVTIASPLKSPDPFPGASKKSPVRLNPHMQNSSRRLDGH